jgi:hypothetical protein
VSEGKRWAEPIRYWQVCGVIVFVLSYFLPACRGEANGAGNRTFLGYECVLPSLWFVGMFLTGPFAKGGSKANIGSWSALVKFVSYLVVCFGGLLNCAVPIYLLATLSTMRHSGKLAVAVTICALLALPEVLLMHFTPLIGFYLWVAGALLILIPELRKPAEPPLAPSSPTGSVS